MKKLTREELITKLIDDDVAIILSGEANSYVVDILRDGFCGYKKYSLKGLQQEYFERLSENNLDQ